MPNVGDRVTINARSPFKHWVGCVGTVVAMHLDSKYGMTYRIHLDVPMPHPRLSHLSPRNYLTAREYFIDVFSVAAQPSVKGLPVAAPQPVLETPKVKTVKPIKRMPPNFGRTDVLTVWDLADIQKGQ